MFCPLLLRESTTGSVNPIARPAAESLRAVSARIKLANVVWLLSNCHFSAEDVEQPLTRPGPSSSAVIASCSQMAGHQTHRRADLHLSAKLQNAARIRSAAISASTTRHAERDAADRPASHNRDNFQRCRDGLRH